MSENKTRCAEGVWCATSDNEYGKPVVLSVHAGELEARRAAMEHYDTATVLYVEWDESIDSARASALATTNEKGENE